MSFLVTITVGQSSMRFFPSLLFKNDRSLRNDALFFSLNNVQRFHHHRYVDRQSKDLGLNPSAVESVFFSTKRFQILKFIFY